MRRRELLAAGGAALAALGGCVSRAASGPSGRGRVRVHEDSHAQFSFELGAPGRLSYALRVVDGPRIDALLLPGWDLAAYRSGGAFRTHGGGSREAVDRAVVAVDLDPGRWTLVFDNRNPTGHRPPADWRDSVATVEYRYDAG